MTERIERWGRGLASLALLVGLVVGVPAALAALGGNPLPQRFDLPGLWSALLRPDDGTVLVRLLALVGWAAWAVFTLTVVVELANLARSRPRGLVLPGLGGVQQWAAGLMLTVVAIGSASQLTSPAAPSTTHAAAETGRPTGTTAASPAPAAAPDVRTGGTSSPRGRPPATPVDPGGAQPVVGLGEDAAAGQVATRRTVAPVSAPHGRVERVHVVQPGDDLWSLAERYYGRGQEWRRIAAANPDRLTGGPDRLRAGWRLVVPDAGEGSAATDAEGSVTVRGGDTLSSIAAERLGDPDRWHELYRANRDQLTDPDDLPVGVVLRLPGAAGAVAGERATSSADPEPAAPDEGGAVGGTPTPGNASSPPSTESAPPPTDPPPLAATAEARPSAAAEAGAGAGSTVDPGTSTALPTTVAFDRAEPPQEQVQADDDPGLLLPGLATVGGLLAAALTGGLAARRRWQLQRLPVGRRVAQPPAATRPVEVALARRTRPIGLRTLDRASRAVAASAAEAGLPVPGLRSASVSPDRLVLELDGPVPPAPRCFVDTGTAWCLAADAVDGLRDVPGLGEARRPWPLLVGVGAGDDGADRVVDLESLGLLAVTGEPSSVTGAVAATVLELACSPWTEHLRLLLVGDTRLAPALAQHNVESTSDLEAVLDRLERTATDRVAHADGRRARDLRADPDRAEAWTPEVVVVDVPLTPDQAERFVRLTRQPGAAVSAIVRGAVEGAGASLVLEGSDRALLQPEGLHLVPQVLAGPGLDAVVELVRSTGSEETTPAPWWSAEDDPPDEPPDNVTYLGARRRADESDGQQEQERRAAVQARMTEVADGTVRHPLLQLLGPVELLGATGPAPARASRQCLEYCAWLLENPGTTAQAMAAGLLVAEGTRRSNMSRLRTWLGAQPEGQSYLPDAYSGRIWLDPLVSSDWHQLQLLVGDGVDRAPTTVLELGLRLVRGAPLADAAPVQWHWAETLRTDMIACVRDIGVELSRRALAERDLDLARWAAARALAAAPGDEPLMRARLRTEHLAGNSAETERLSLQIAQHARMLGADLDPATVDLIQEVMEGRIRARLA